MTTIQAFVRVKAQLKSGTQMSNCGLPCWVTTSGAHESMFSVVIFDLRYAESGTLLSDCGFL